MQDKISSSSTVQSTENSPKSPESFDQIALGPELYIKQSIYEDLNSRLDDGLFL